MKSINLTPPSQKKQLALEKTGKLVLVLSLVVLVALFCFVLVMLALKFYMLQEIVYQKAALDMTEKHYQNADFLPYKDIISSSNANVQTTNSFYKSQIHVVKALTALFNVAHPADVRFSSVTVEKKEAGVISATISGFAKTREGLQDFKKNLEAEALVEHIYFPPESWVKPNNIDFNLTLDVRQKP